MKSGVTSRKQDIAVKVVGRVFSLKPIELISAESRHPLCCVDVNRVGFRSMIQ
jgi:hypothetical protein